MANGQRYSVSLSGVRCAQRTVPLPQLVAAFDAILLEKRDHGVSICAVRVAYILLHINIIYILHKQ
jgi:hypothetical protein